jgi:hypothetical protein
MCAFQYAFGPDTVGLVSSNPMELVEKLTVAAVELQSKFSLLKPVSLDSPSFEMTHWHSGQKHPVQTGSSGGFHFPSLGGSLPLMNLFSHNHFIGYGGILYYMHTKILYVQQESHQSDQVDTTRIYLQKCVRRRYGTTTSRRTLGRGESRRTISY